MIGPADILKASILIVDDQEANVSLLDQMLRGAGYVSITSTTNPRAVQELHRQHRYDLILLDLQMPGFDGFQVMENLKEIEADNYLPVLVITAQPNHRLQALKAGARDFVSKPFDLAEVLIRVHNMVEVRLLHLESKCLCRELQDANQELEAFSYSVSHDLRAPLAHIMGFAELLQRKAGPSLSEENRNYLTMIAEAAKRMGNLITDILAFSHLGHAVLNKAEVNVDGLNQEILQEFQAETKARQITWDIHPLPMLLCDRALLRMVLVNLLANAVKFTRNCPAPRIEIGCISESNGENVIFVRDNGAGFDSKYVGKLFGVFQRLHKQEEFEGTGIGLANVQRIVKRHGGRVWAEGEVDKGATFYFSLPRSEPPKPPVSYSL
jgi:signal transduction histidine kinase